jgi:hypothetical protein
MLFTDLRRARYYDINSTGRVSLLNATEWAQSFSAFNNLSPEMKVSSLKPRLQCSYLSSNILVQQRTCPATYLSSNILVQQHTCPATYLSSKKVTPVYNAHTCQATYMCSGRMKVRVAMTVQYSEPKRTVLNHDSW